MDSLFFSRLIAQQISDKDPLGILHSLEIRIDKHWRWCCHHATSPLWLFCRFLSVPLLLLYYGLNVASMVIDGHPFVTHGTFGVPTLVTSVGNDRVLGLALETGFELI